jgi:hypothetical protein
MFGPEFDRALKLWFFSVVALAFVAGLATAGILHWVL